MVTTCFKATLYAGFGLAAVNFITNIIAIVDWDSTLSDYESRAMTIVGDSTGKYDTDSAWFSAISEEYDGLSSFDKENVYCDIDAIQSAPYEHLSEGWSIFVLAMVLMGITVLVIGVVSCSLCCLCSYDILAEEVFKEVEMTTGKDPENPPKKGAKKAKKAAKKSNKRDIERENAMNHPCKPDEARENSWALRSFSAILFIETGPFLALVWLMITRKLELTGTSCQEMFFDCGKSEDCSLDDLMAPVPLNSSVLKFATADPLLAASFFSCLVNLVFIVISGAVLCIRSRDLTHLVLPVIQLVFALLPAAWVIYIVENMEGVPIGEVEGVIALAHLPWIALLCATCVNCFRSRRSRKASRASGDRKPSRENK